jgi:hypothetical protein
MPHAPPSAERGEHVVGAESKFGHRGTYLSYRPATVKGHVTRKERTSSAIASSFSKTEARIRRFRHSR